MIVPASLILGNYWYYPATIDTRALNTVLVVVLLIPGAKIGCCNSAIDTRVLSTVFVVVLWIPGRKIGSCNRASDTRVLNTVLVLIILIPQFLR